MATFIEALRANEERLPDIPHKDGQFIITDAGNIYADFPTERVEFNDGGGTFLAVPDQTTYQEIIDAMDAGKNVQTFVTVENISVCISLFVISRHSKQCLFAGIIPAEGTVGAIGILVEENENGKTTWSSIENTQLATTNYVDDTIDTLIGNAPDLLNTLNELAAALNNDANFATNILQQLDSKVTKEPGKGLFSGSYKHLTDTPTIPTSLSQLKGDTSHRTITDAQIEQWNGKIGEETDPTVPTYLKGEIYTAFPERDSIINMPDDTYFNVLTTSIKGVTDKQYNICNYIAYIKKSGTDRWAYGNPIVQYADNGKYHVVLAVNHSIFPEILVTDYGILPGSEYATKNSEIMQHILQTADYGATLRFPMGRFYFENPIDLTESNSSDSKKWSNAHFNIIGTVNSAYKHQNIAGGTWLCFPNITSGPALKVNQCTLENFNLVGGCYSYKLDRGEKQHQETGSCGNSGCTSEYNCVATYKDVVPTVTITETINGTAKTYSNAMIPDSDKRNPSDLSIGIHAAGGIIRNIGIEGFYTGIFVPNSNMTIHQVSCARCHYGVILGTDIKVFDYTAWDTDVALRINGSLCSATGIRGDSIGSHLVEIGGGGRHTLTDLDSDFGLGSLVHIVNNASVSNLAVHGVHGRIGAIDAVRTHKSAIKTARDTEPCRSSVLSLGKTANLDGAIINTNQGGVIDPFDHINNINTPYILMSGDTGCEVKNVQITCTTGYDTEDETAIRTWTKERVNIRGTAKNIKINTSRGYVMYNGFLGATGVQGETVTLDRERFSNNLEYVEPSANINPNSKYDYDYYTSKSSAQSVLGYGPHDTGKIAITKKFIPVEPGKEYYVISSTASSFYTKYFSSDWVGMSLCVSFYDENKNYKNLSHYVNAAGVTREVSVAYCDGQQNRYFSIVGSDQRPEYQMKLVIPEGVKYIKYQIISWDFGSLQQSEIANGTFPELAIVESDSGVTSFVEYAGFNEPRLDLRNGILLSSSGYYFTLDVDDSGQLIATKL